MTAEEIDQAIEEHFGNDQGGFAEKMEAAEAELESSENFNRLLRQYQSYLQPGTPEALVMGESAERIVEMALIEGVVLGRRFANTAEAHFFEEVDA